MRNEVKFNSISMAQIMRYYKDDVHKDRFMFF